MREGLRKIVLDDETIVAISTPLGHSGIGVIRMSGRSSLDIAHRCFKPNSRISDFPDRSALAGVWADLDGKEIDQVVLTFFQAPRSYTGEDVVEISAHGNPFLLQRIVESAKARGARLAAAGEFTLRAVAHGKMDLVQAEAVRDFIEVQTEQQAKTALSQIEGSLSKRLRPMKSAVVDIIARLEAGIDFAEDDVSVPANALIASSIRDPLAQLEALRDSFGYGKILANGLRLAILGKPNVGKSSLFNRLVSNNRAIVTAIPGTTRDVLTETISIEGVPVRLADTAGLRDTTDVVETIGVTRTLEALSEADFAIVVLDGSGNLEEDDRRTLRTAEGIPHLIVINKCDLSQTLDTHVLNGANRVSISAMTGQGIDELLNALRAFLSSCKADLVDDLILTNVRQYDAVTEAVFALTTAQQATIAGVPHEMVLLDLYHAIGALDELTGEVVTEDILDRIFSTFCVGK